MTTINFLFKFIRRFWISSFISTSLFILAGVTLGPGVLWILAVLVALEVTFSFDNAVVNAKRLVELPPFWQKLFLTVGMLIAVLGMRVIFPILIVALTANIPFSAVLDMALNQPGQYAHRLELAHPTISAFGGAFLLMLTLYFFLDHEKEVHWLHKLEKRLKKLGDWWIPPLLSALVIMMMSIIPANHHPGVTLQAGLIGVATYFSMHIATSLMDRNSGKSNGKKAGTVTGWAAFMVFAYLEVLDASFSFDGVIGAFAVTSEVVLIAIGLGLGALWVRSFTVYMVKRKTLESYIYLEHGAHYAIGVLAVAMLFSLMVPVPEVVTGLTGVGIIVSAIVSSVRIRRAVA